MAAEEGDTKFVSKLDEASKKRVKEELNELNDEDRLIAVRTLRQWINDQDWLSSPTDFQFLLRFLRVRKFSQLAARETIENYWTSKTVAPDWFRDANPKDPIMLEIFRSGYLVCAKVYDSKGRRTLFERPGCIDIDVAKKKWGLHTIYKAIGLFVDWCMMDENMQANGMNAIVDFTNVSFATLSTLWSVESGKQMFKYYAHSMPIRIKSVNMYNEPQYFDAIFTLLKPFLKQKFLDRTRFHGNSLVGVYNVVEKRALPVEYLPDDYTGPNAGTVQEAIDSMIEDMTSDRFMEHMKNISSDRYGVDLEKRKRSDKQQSESYRRLNVD